MADALALWIVWLLVAILLVAVLGAVGITVRRLLLERGGGNVECGLRCGADQRWRLGLAAYQSDELRWFSAFGVRLRPAVAFSRSALAVVARRPATALEAASLGWGAVVVECRIGAQHDSVRPGPGQRGPAPRQGGQRGGGPVELAMGEAALTGFLAWLEAAPPGHQPGLD